MSRKKRGARVLRKKSQAATEYLMFAGLILFVSVGIIGAAWHSESPKAKANQMQNVVNAVQSVVNAVWKLGAGNTRCIVVNMPKNVKSFSMANNEVIAKIQVQDSISELTAKTNARAIGAFPVDEGMTRLCFSIAGPEIGQGNQGGERIVQGGVEGSTSSQGDGCLPLSGDPDCDDSVTTANNGGFNYGSADSEFGSTSICGDGFTGGSETCEVGSSCGSGDRCNQENCQCELGSNAYCGDGVTGYGEQCDKSDWACPPAGTQVSGGQCKDGTTKTQPINQYCTGSCTCAEGGNVPLSYCGDGTRNSPTNSCDETEECDGNPVTQCPILGSTCVQCECVPPTCPNGIKEAGEQCDGAGQAQCADGQVCSATCHCTPIGNNCPNGILDPGEECETHTPCDGSAYTCSSCLCVGCGNSRVESGESCDDGNTANGDGCSSTCQAETACGATAAPTCGGACTDGQTCVPGPYQWCECKDPCAQDPNACNLGSCERGHCEKTTDAATQKEQCACVRRKAGQSCYLTSDCDPNLYCVSGFCGTPPGSGAGYVGNPCASGMPGTSCGGTTYDGSLCVPMNGPGSPVGTNCIAMTDGGAYEGGVPIGNYGGECIGGMGGSCNPGQGSCTQVTESANPNAWICSD